MAFQSRRSFFSGTAPPIGARLGGRPGEGVAVAGHQDGRVAVQLGDDVLVVVLAPVVGVAPL